MRRCPAGVVSRHPRLSIVRRRCRLLHLYNQRGVTRSDLYFLKGQVKAGRCNRPTMLSCTVEAKRGLQSSRIQCSAGLAEGCDLRLPEVRPLRGRGDGDSLPAGNTARHPRLSIVRRRCRLLHLYNQRGNPKRSLFNERQMAKWESEDGETVPPCLTAGGT